jgi:ABC-type amino acid transport substrate-binding protein
VRAVHGMQSEAEIRAGGVVGVLLLVAAVTILAGTALAGTLDTIRQGGVVRLAYREDAPPFSFKSSDGQPTGYSVALCRAVAADLKDQLKMPELTVQYVAVNSVNRFDAIQKSQADMLCEATSETLKRRKIVDFSIPTFISGASLIIRADGPTSLREMDGKKIGVLAGTTTEEALRESLKDAAVNADVIAVKTHQEGVQMVATGGVSAYFADRTILQYLRRASKSSNLLLGDDYLTYEPYALALPYGDEDFRLAVDRALSDLYRSGKIESIFMESFGKEAKASPLLRHLYVISALPE